MNGELKKIIIRIFMYILLVIGIIEYLAHLYKALTFESDDTLLNLVLWVPVIAIASAYLFKKSKKIRKATVIVLVFIMSAIIGLTSAYSWLAKPADTPSPVTMETPAKDETVPPSVESLFTLINQERQKVGVAPLVLDARLNASAQQKADDMNVNSYFDHIDKSGKQGYSYVFEYAPGECSIASENITDNIHTNSSEQAVYAWVHSPTHYQALINTNYTLTGFGISGTKIVEHFCQPA